MLSNLLHMQLPSECDYLQSTRAYGDYQLIIAINLTVKPIATSNKYILMSHSTDNDNDNDINCDARDDSGENNNDDVKKVNISLSLSAKRN